MSRRPVIELIVANPPARPACFETQEAWESWLVTAHAAGERIVRRVDVGRTRADRRAGKKGNRSTHFEVLPIEQIDYCSDCTSIRRDGMRAAGRCSPSVVTVLLDALKSGASTQQLSKLLAARPLTAPTLLQLYEALCADLRKAQASMAAAKKNARARQHVTDAWARHQQQVEHGTAEPMSRTAFAAMMVSAMAKNPAFNDSRGEPFSVAPRRIAEHWLSPSASNVRTLPATSVSTEPAAPAPQE